MPGAGGSTGRCLASSSQGKSVQMDHKQYHVCILHVIWKSPKPSALGQSFPETRPARCGREHVGKKTCPHDRRGLVTPRRDRAGLWRKDRSRTGARRGPGCAADSLPPQDPSVSLPLGGLAFSLAWFFDFLGCVQGCGCSISFRGDIMYSFNIDPSSPCRQLKS